MEIKHQGRLDETDEVGIERAAQTGQIRAEDEVETIVTKGKATVTQHLLARLISEHASQDGVDKVCTLSVSCVFTEETSLSAVT